MFNLLGVFLKRSNEMSGNFLHKDLQRNVKNNKRFDVLDGDELYSI